MQKADGGRQSIRDQGAARERILRAAYDLFSRNSLNTVGVDRIVAEADVAKTTLYRHFPSKDDLAVAVLRRHEDVWTKEWLQQEITARAATPGAQLLAVFDAFDEWFRGEDYEGCLFARILLETRDPASPVRAAAATGLGNIRAVLRRLAAEAGADDPDALALQIQMLLLGAIVAAIYGDPDAAKQARAVAEVVLEEKIGLRSS